jgi:two-component system chemotaxis response regulator CheB
MAADRPVPVVVCSGLQRGASAVRALEEGAVAVVEKPRFDVRGFLLESALSLVETVQGAAQARLRSRRTRGLGTGLPPVAPLAHMAPPVSPTRSEVIVAVGASTGGPQALLELLMALPADAPAVLIVQHMPAGFTRAFAERLDRSCRLEVREARAQDVPRSGLALVAPGDRHMVLRRRGAGYLVQLSDGPQVSRHRPSVDVLFRSVAHAAGAHAVGAILTGMGDDGADGLLEMRRAGAATLAQDEGSSVVFGMPKEALARGAAQSAVPLSHLAGAILSRACQPRHDEDLTPTGP